MGGVIVLPTPEGRVPPEKNLLGRKGESAQRPPLGKDGSSENWGKAKEKSFRKTKDAKARQIRRILPPGLEVGAHYGVEKLAVSKGLSATRSAASKRPERESSQGACLTTYLRGGTHAGTQEIGAPG